MDYIACLGNLGTTASMSEDESSDEEDSESETEEEDDPAVDAVKLQLTYMQ